MQKRHDPTTRGRKINFISPGRCSLLELQAAIVRCESYVSRHEKKLKDKLDDEIKLACLEALVPEELEKHLILDSNRLRTFEDARQEIVTYVEAKLGLRIRESKPSDKRSRKHSDRMGQFSLVRQKKKGQRVHEMFFQVRSSTCSMRLQCTQRQRPNKHLAKARVRRARGPRKRNSKKVPQARTRVKPRRLVYPVLKTPKPETSSETQECAQT